MLLFILKNGVDTFDIIMYPVVHIRNVLEKEVISLIAVIQEILPLNDGGYIKIKSVLRF